MTALAQMEAKILLKRTAIFSCTCKATKGSSCECLEKKQFLKKIVANSWIKLLKNTLFYRDFERDFSEKLVVWNFVFLAILQVHEN